MLKLQWFAGDAEELKLRRLESIAMKIWAYAKVHRQDLGIEQHIDNVRKMLSAEYDRLERKLNKAESKIESYQLAVEFLRKKVPPAIAKGKERSMTAEQAVRLCELYFRTSLSQETIAKHVGVNTTTIKRIVDGTTHTEATAAIRARYKKQHDELHEVNDE